MRKRGRKDARERRERVEGWRGGNRRLDEGTRTWLLFEHQHLVDFKDPALKVHPDYVLSFAGRTKQGWVHSAGFMVRNTVTGWRIFTMTLTCFAPCSGLCDEWEQKETLTLESSYRRNYSLTPEGQVEMNFKWRTLYGLWTIHSHVREACKHRNLGKPYSYVISC